MHTYCINTPPHTHTHTHTHTAEVYAQFADIRSYLHDKDIQPLKSNLSQRLAHSSVMNAKVWEYYLRKFSTLANLHWRANEGLKHSPVESGDRDRTEKTQKKPHAGSDRALEVKKDIRKKIDSEGQDDITLCKAQWGASLLQQESNIFYFIR